MEDTARKEVKRAFPIHQFEKEEQFLMDMEKEGWRLEKIKYEGKPVYVFEPCEPQDTIYQMDYILESEDTPEYHADFETAGYEQAFDWPGYGGIFYYYRKKRELGDKVVSTQSASFSTVFNRIGTKYFLFLMLFAYLEYNGYQLLQDKIAAGALMSGEGIGIIVMMGVFAAFVVYFVYHIFSIFHAQSVAKKRIG